MPSNEELTRVLNPDYTETPEPHSPPAGDWRDDDGRALASYFLANDPMPLVSRIVRAVVDALPPPTGTKNAPMGNRLVRASYLLTPGALAVYALQPDENRVNVLIRDNNAAGFYFSDSSFAPVDDFAATVAHQTPAVFVAPPAAGQIALITLENYTGPLYISGKFAGGVNSAIEVVAITA